MKIFFLSLGCDKNLTDSGTMMGIAVEHGLELTDDEDSADIIVVNTCCFIGDAKQESINSIIRLGKKKAEGSCVALVVTGCLAQRYREQIKEELPEADAIIGTTSYDMLGEVLEEIISSHIGKSRAASGDGRPVIERFSQPDRLVRYKGHMYSGTPGHYAYLKIAEGCDKRCTYCIIPYVRGPYRSVEEDVIMAQAAGFARQGVKELILVAQETTLYGKDIYGGKSLPGLLRKLCKIQGIEWIRLLYCYPEEITDELIRTIAQEEKICNYLDIPVQHASDDILKRMGRQTTGAKLEETIARLRDGIEGVALRTTVISGFPQETQKDHEILLDFIKRMRFDRLGCFIYSREEGTPAAGFKGRVPKKTATGRRDQIMRLQREISREISGGLVGKVMPAIIEGRVADEDVYVARTVRDAPDVDGLLFINSNAELMTGDIRQALITDAAEYDIMGELVHESAQ